MASQRGESLIPSPTKPANTLNGGQGSGQSVTKRYFFSFFFFLKKKYKKA